MTRSSTIRSVALGLAATTLLAACGGATVTSVPSETPGASDAPATMSDGPSMSELPAMSDAPAMSTSPGSTPAAAGSAAPLTTGDPAASLLAGHAWATATLTDVTTGESFTIADLAGRTVFVEAMAIWCSNCRAQQDRFTEAFRRLPAGSAEYVVLTVDPSETAKELARYKADRGFTGRYAVAGRSVSKALEAEFGANVLNPPSVPLITITTSGEVSFATGGESVEAIVERAGG
jgi:thiol-disulfide isomerase/thioredoxin